MRLGQPESLTTGSCRPHAMEKYKDDDPWLSSSRARSTPASRTCVTASSRTRLALQRRSVWQRRRIRANAPIRRVVPAGCTNLLQRDSRYWMARLVDRGCFSRVLQARANNGGGKLIPQAPRLPDPVRECAASELTLVPSFGRATKDAMTDFAVHEKGWSSPELQWFLFIGWVGEIIQVCTATAQVWPIADRIHDAKTIGKGCVSCVLTSDYRNPYIDALPGGADSSTYSRCRDMHLPEQETPSFPAVTLRGSDLHVSFVASSRKSKPGTDYQRFRVRDCKSQFIGMRTFRPFLAVPIAFMTSVSRHAHTPLPDVAIRTRGLVWPSRATQAYVSQEYVSQEACPSSHRQTCT